MNKISANKYSVIALHSIIWGILFISPYLFSSGQFSMFRIIQRSWIPLLFYALIFYLNYFLLIKKFFFKNEIIVFILVNLFIIALLIWIKQELILKDDMFPHHSHKRGKIPSRSFFIYIESISLIIPVVFAIAIKVGERWLKTEAEKKEMENMKLQSELQHLKYQIQPHFFFNSLNNIYSLVDISPDRAKKTIHTLSKLMRYLLYDSNAEKISLTKEIDFMNKYIELMKLRVTDKTRIHASFPTVSPSVEVAPLLFISIIENAFKHGVSATQTSDIEFFMTIDTHQIHFFSKNRNYPKNYTDKSGSGIGIQNLKKRLELLHPHQYSYVSEVIGEDFVVTLTINLT